MINIIVCRCLLRVAKESDSLAVEADACHLTADIYTSLGLLVVSVVVRITGLDVLDPVVVLLVVLVILRAAYDVLKSSFSGLVDAKLAEEEEDIIASSIMERYGELVGFHKLRTRKAGR